MPMLQWLQPGFDQLHLDIVGFLAILGEASIKANIQVSTLSYSVLLPRLLPAPQALLRASRPDFLKAHAGKIIGAYNGNQKDSINHIAHLLHYPEPLPAYTVQCQIITKSAKGSGVRTIGDGPSVPATGKNSGVSAKPYGPLVWLNLFGSAVSILLLVFAIIRKDGFALLATILLSMLSTMIGLGGQWSLTLMPRSVNRPNIPSGDVVIMSPRAAFVIVKCDENIARELYWHPEKCVYTLGDTVYRIISLAGTLILMFGVICLGNSTLPLQVAFGAAYIILNAAYWTVAALPPQSHWDLSCYEVKKKPYVGSETVSNYTQALWRAMAVAESARWVRTGRIAPDHEAWDEWIKRANERLKEWRKERKEAAPNGKNQIDDQSLRPNEIPDWDPEGVLTEIFREYATYHEHD